MRARPRYESFAADHASMLSRATTKSQPDEDRCHPRVWARVQFLLVPRLTPRWLSEDRFDPPASSKRGPGTLRTSTLRHLLQPAPLCQDSLPESLCLSIIRLSGLERVVMRWRESPSFVRRVSLSSTRAACRAGRTGSSTNAQPYQLMPGIGRLKWCAARAPHDSRTVRLVAR